VAEVERVGPLANSVVAADELGLERFSLVGHSMGGTMMQRVYVGTPGRLRYLGAV
jgi:pimeloyl-ACP methyl ester carboxylesterase